MTYEKLQFKKTGVIAEINLGATYFDKLMMSEMNDVLDKVCDDSDIKFFIVSGHDGVFNKGIDFYNFSDSEMIDVADFNRWEKLTHRIQNINAVTKIGRAHV